MRINPQEIHELYKKWNRTPRCGTFRTEEKCCPLAILYLDKYGENKDGDAVADKMKIEYNSSFIDGFWRGFDNAPAYCYTNNDKEEFDAGFENGVIIQKYLSQFYQLR